MPSTCKSPVRVFGAKNPRVASARALIGESRHYCAGDRRKHCEFVRGNMFIFISGFVKWRK